MTLRHAFISAAQSGVTVLAASGDSGTANGTKQPVARGGFLLPYPSVEWPASDPLVTGVGGTYLCTDPTATTSEARTPYIVSGVGARCSNPAFGGAAEVAWTFSGGGFSQVFPKPGWQNALPAGSTPISTMRGWCRFAPDLIRHGARSAFANPRRSVLLHGNGDATRAPQARWPEVRPGGREARHGLREQRGLVAVGQAQAVPTGAVRRELRARPDDHGMVRGEV